MTQTDDSTLIENTLKGDVKSFEKIVERYQQMVYTLAFRIIKNHQEAEEIAQDVFLKIYKSLSSFNQKSKLSTWVYKITFNSSINKLNSQKRTIETTQINGFAEQKFNNTENASQRIEDEERHETIKTALSRLSETDSTIVSLYYYEEMSVKEIAEIVGLSKQNVKIKLHRSRKKLYLELKDKVSLEIKEENGF